MNRVVLAVTIAISSAVAIDAATVAHKGIVPIIGTTIQTREGVGFDTTLRLVGKPGLRGRLVFHPANQIADDATDPSVRYSCQAFRCLDGSAGMFRASVPMIGSMDIIPDPDTDPSIPVVYTRVFYGSPSYPPSLMPIGSDVPRIIADEWFREQSEGNSPTSFAIPNLGLGIRIKLGLRTLTPVTYSVTLMQNGLADTTPAVSHATLPADYTLFLPIESVIGSPLGPFADVRVDIESGSAIGFYSYTQNFTNEPQVVVAAPSEGASASTVP
jgi:hypothetical protein